MDYYTLQTDPNNAASQTSQNAKNRAKDNTSDIAFGALFAEFISQPQDTATLADQYSYTQNDTDNNASYNDDKAYNGDTSYIDTTYRDDHYADSYTDRDDDYATNDVDERKETNKAESKDTDDVDSASDNNDTQDTAQTNRPDTPLVSAEQLAAIQNIVDPNALSDTIAGSAETTAASTVNLTVKKVTTNADIQNAEVGQILMIDGQDLGTATGILERISARIEQLQDQSDASGILFNLTPQQMTQLQNDITAAMNSGDMPTPPDGFSFIMANLTAPTAATNISSDDISLIQTLPFAQSNGLKGGTGQDMLAASDVDTNSMNPLLQNGSDMPLDDLMDIQSSTDKFSALLKNAARLRQQSENAQAPQVQQNNASNGAEAAKATNETTNVTTSTATLSGLSYDNGSLLTSLGWDQETLFQMGLATAGNAGQTMTNSSAQLVNLASHARGATQPHPSTAMVAATLSKAAGANGNKSITLQLDPPELGRVEVRMEFGSDNTLKTQIISEKPEAHMMMQRDAQILEKALQDSGLDTSANGLEFTLADDNQNFDQDGSHDGSRNQASHGDNAEDEQDIMINTTMTMLVDPDTGHTHYSILA